MEKQYIRCDLSKEGKKRSCQRIGSYDGNSIMHYPPKLTTQVIEDGNYIDKTFKVFKLKDEAHSLCHGGRCNPGQREGLSRHDISDIATLYQTTCGRKI